MSNKQLEVGARVARRQLLGIDGEAVAMPDPQQRIHLQFRRFAGCPFCSLHLNSVAQRYAEIRAAGIVEVVVFRATADQLGRHHPDLPFPIVADPSERLYAEFGVESAVRSVVNPRAWIAGLRGLALRLPRFPVLPTTLGGAIGLPADFLIDAGGRILARKYGEHAYDQWSVDELIGLARSAAPDVSSVSSSGD